jgi:four helix bundle protein
MTHVPASEAAPSSPAAEAVALAGALAAHPLRALEPAATAPPPAPVVLDAEKLICYDVALELQVLASGLVPAQHRVLQDQMERASLSCVCNIAEGAGRRSRRDKRRFYAMARGSATEVAAIVDVLRLRRLAPERACAAARSHAVRLVQLLTKLDASLA